MTPSARATRAQRASARALLAASRLFAALPSRLAFAIADLATPLVVLSTALHDRRVGPLGRGMRRNLAIAFREALTPARARRLRWAWARHAAWLVVDFLRLPRLGSERLARQVDAEAFGAIRALVAEGRGLIVVSGHIGVWEGLGPVSTLLGARATLAARPLGSAPLDAAVTAIRESSGTRVLAKWGVLWPLVARLRRGELVGLLADEEPTTRAVFAPFLGTLAASSPTPAFLQRKTGAPIAVVSLQRTGRERFHLHVWRVIRPREGDVEAETLRVTTEINEALSRAILADPPQWLWGSRRFQTRPADEKPGPDGLPPAV